MLTPVSERLAIFPSSSQQTQLRQTAQAFEQIFLSQALQAAGLHRPSTEMSGGAGEEMFASFLVEAHTRALVMRGGVGLAEHLVRTLGDGAGK